MNDAAEERFGRLLTAMYWGEEKPVAADQISGADSSEDYSGTQSSPRTSASHPKRCHNLDRTPVEEERKTALVK